MAEYKNIEYDNDEISEEIALIFSKLLTAKMAREYTNICALTKLKQFLDTEVEPKARAGEYSHTFTINKKYDVKYLKGILKELGYAVTLLKEDSEKIYCKLTW